MLMLIYAPQSRRVLSAQPFCTYHTHARFYRRGMPCIPATRRSIHAAVLGFVVNERIGA